MTCIFNIEEIGTLATGSNDTYIRLYENKRGLTSKFK